MVSSWASMVEWEPLLRDTASLWCRCPEVHIHDITWLYMYSCRKDASPGDLQHIDWCLWRSWHVIEKGYQCADNLSSNPFQAWRIVARMGPRMEGRCWLLAPLGLARAVTAQKHRSYWQWFAHPMPSRSTCDIYIYKVSIHPCSYLSIWRRKKTL